MGFFSDVVNASATGSCPNFEVDNQYFVEIEEVKHLQSKNDLKKGVEYFIVEAKVLDSSNKSHVGTTRGWVVNLSHSPAAGNVKGFITATFGIKEDEITEDALKAIVSPANPMKGKRVRLEVFNTETTKGNPFSVHKWIHVVQDEDIKIPAANNSPRQSFNNPPIGDEDVLF